MERGGKSDFEERYLSKEITRRKFIEGAFKVVGALAAEEIGRHFFLGQDIAEAAVVEAGKTPEPQIDIPPGTYLTSQPEWYLKLVKRVPEDVLIQFNGPKSTWNFPEFGGVFVVPNSYFGGKDGLDSSVKERLAGKVVFRADVGRDESSDEGWPSEELKLVQGLLAQAVKRGTNFFGKSRFSGFIRVTRPGKERREQLKQQFQEPVAGAIGEGSKPGTLQIWIMTSLAEFAEMFSGASTDQIVDMYVKELKDLLTHEVAHAMLLGTKFGSLDNHSVVRAAGASAVLVDLLGKSAEDVRKAGSFTDLQRPEMLLWKAFKVKGVEFYAQLLERLIARYGKDRLEYTDDEVEEVAKVLFERAGFDFSYQELLDSFGKVPDEGSIQTRPMDGYRYPTEKVVGDQYNPDGNVSWWVEAKSLSPISIGVSKEWVNPPSQVFPDENGFYTVYKFIGNGKLKDGPPGGNSFAVATWKKGGSLTGSDLLFPMAMAETEIIRAEKKK